MRPHDKDKINKNIKEENREELYIKKNGLSFFSKENNEKFLKIWESRFDPDTPRNPADIQRDQEQIAELTAQVGPDILENALNTRISGSSTSQPAYRR